MTPQFTTPCYMRVEDADKRKEICDKLKRIGYGLGQFYIDMLDNMIITYPKIGNTFCTGMTGQFDKIDIKGCIDCGTNTALFLALAGMRDDTDKGQWFFDLLGNDWICKQDNLPEKFRLGNFHRATAAEIIEHFNNKTK